MGYLLMATSEMLKEWKVAITSVGQGYKFTEWRQDYQIRTRTTHREKSAPMDIGKINIVNEEKNTKLKKLEIIENKKVTCNS